MWKGLVLEKLQGYNHAALLKTELLQRCLLRIFNRIEEHLFRRTPLGNYFFLSI